MALLEEVCARHFTTGTPLTLRRGQIGTVVVTSDGTGRFKGKPKIVGVLATPVAIPGGSKLP